MKNIYRYIIILAAVTAAAAVVIYYLISAFVIGQAREHIRNVLFTNRGLHHYIQRNMLPQFFSDRDAGYISKEYYSPVVFSSSYMVRVLHTYFNEERRAGGMSEVYYKMAAANPRNPVNIADDDELELLKKFNYNRNLKEVERIVIINGKRYMHYSIPFLETNAACLRCHGDRSNAPPGLQKLYSGNGGFGEKAGTIRAVESIKVHIDDELGQAVILTGTATSGFIVFIIMFVFGSRMRKEVKEKTIHLRREMDENIEAGRRIAESLKEKEVLLKEVHHRVKNNMAIISSFLELQSMSAEGDEVQGLLQESIRRIRSMALVHEKLYLSKNFADINVKDYITQLLYDLTDSYGRGHEMVQISIDDMDFELDRLINVGLLVNEIAMNSYKYAFNSIDNPCFHLKMYNADNYVIMEIGDNGPGIPEASLREKKGSLGLDIINALSARLKAEISVDNTNGARYIIKIPVSAKGEHS
jgi:two-component sensor histidine kinase